MADELTPTPPRKLDRAALDRVLARAAELQSSSIEGSDLGGLTEAEIIDLGKEAGMSAEHLRQAMAEERTRSAPTPDDRGIAASIIGKATVRASRVVPGSPRELLDVIDSWMQRQEALKVKRRVSDRIVWEPRSDLVASLQRGFSLGGEFSLSKAAEVSCTATGLEAGRTLITLDAGMASYRTTVGTTAGVFAGAGAGASVIAAVVGIMIPVAVIPAIVVAPVALMISRSAQAKAVDRGQLALEQLLDHLERGDHRKPGGLLAAISAAAEEAVKVIRL